MNDRTSNHAARTERRSREGDVKYKQLGPAGEREKRRENYVSFNHIFKTTSTKILFYI